MPNMQWSKLNRMQLGRYAEYYAKMEYTSYGFDVYTSEVDDHGVDFVVRDSKGKFSEVQVKAVRNNGYVFLLKDRFRIADDNMLCLLKFVEDQLPEVYIIPSTAWLEPNSLLVDHDYGEGLKSSPEWGINLSKKNQGVLEQYCAAKFFERFGASTVVY